MCVFVLFNGATYCMIVRKCHELHAGKGIPLRFGRKKIMESKNIYWYVKKKRRRKKLSKEENKVWKQGMIE